MNSLPSWPIAYDEAGSGSGILRLEDTGSPANDFNNMPTLRRRWMMAGRLDCGGGQEDEPRFWQSAV